MPNTTTGLDIVTRAAKSLGTLASGEQLTSDEAQDMLDLLNEMISEWGTESLTIYSTPRNVYTLVVSQQTYTIGAGGNFNQQWPESITEAGVLPVQATQPLEMPIQILTLDQWARIGTKSTTSTFPFSLYYDRAFTAGLGNISFWPIPSTAAQVALYTPTRLSEFADLSTTYYIPPGYAAALRYNLANKMSLEFGTPIDPRVVENAVTSKANIMRANIALYDMSVDPALTRRSNLWNFYTGTSIRNA